MPDFYEFFAGGGMARAGLGPRWRCAFANDFDHKKVASYRRNWAAGEMRPGDVGEVDPDELPGNADLAWASFPCQDLSLAGGGAGLKGERSGTFWPFWRLLSGLGSQGRMPTVVALENVCGALTSHGGADFAAIGGALVGQGYRFGALVVDAAMFLPQSRPRLFIIAVQGDATIPGRLLTPGPCDPWHTAALRTAVSRLPESVASSWLWWDLPVPEPRATSLSDLIEDCPTGVAWHSSVETERLLGMMSPRNLAKVEAAKKMARRMVGGVYKRTRMNGPGGTKVQRAEIRFDDVSGCLRTPAGGSSRQVIVVVDGSSVMSRLISTRETARLMGLPDSYVLPTNYNEAYHLAGDGVAVPVVRHLANHILERVVASNPRRALAAA